MRTDEEIAMHIRYLDSQGRMPCRSSYFAACANTTLEFIELPDGVYSNIVFCEYKQELAENTTDDAQAVIDAMNSADDVCPVCHKKAKYRLYTEDDFARRDKFCTLNKNIEAIKR